MAQSQRGQGGDTGPVTGPPTEQDEEPHLSLENTLKLPGGPASHGQQGRRRLCTWEPTSYGPPLPSSHSRASGEQGAQPPLEALVHRDSCQSLGQARPGALSHMALPNPKRQQGHPTRVLYFRNLRLLKMRTLLSNQKAPS